MTALRVWLGRVLTVETDGTTASELRLETPSDGQVWHRWTSPLPPVETLSDECEAILQELAREWPTRSVGVQFVALDKSGGVLSQCPKTIRGSNKGASSASAEESLANAVSSLTKTAEAMLNSANVQISILTKTVETLGERHHEALTMVAQLNETRVLQQQAATSENTFETVAKMVQMLPAVLDQLAVHAQKIKPPTALAVAKPNGKTAS